MNEQEIHAGWERYYKAFENRQPRELFLEALKIVDAAPEKTPGRQAIDLGCGDGVETAVLLSRGWLVCAIDRTPQAITLLRQRVPQADLPRLTTQNVIFRDAQLTPADFVYAGLSLPFCEPADFPLVWQNVVRAICPGGWFAGHIFGERDGWANNPHMSFFTVSALQELFSAFHLITFNEVESEAATACHPSKHWHIFEIIAQKKQ